MSRAGSGFLLDPGNVIRQQFSILQVELIDHDLVHPKVGNETELISNIYVERMRVRSLLPVWIDTGTVMLNKSVASPSRPSSRIGSTHTLPPV